MARLNKVSLLMVLSACGQPLVDGDYRGEQLYSLSGNVRLDGIDSWDPRLNANLRVALFWAGARADQPIEERQEQALVAITEFPARYTLEFYAPPPDDVLFVADWAGGAQIAVATPLLYSDDDGDGLWNPDTEELMGGSPDIAMLFAIPQVKTDVSSMAMEQPYVEVTPGFQTMYANVDHCAPEGGAVFFPTSGDPVDLWVGDLWGGFTDWNCDGQAGEWIDACPPPEELFNMCDPMMAPDPFLVECGVVCSEVEPSAPPGGAR